MSDQEEGYIGMPVGNKSAAYKLCSDIEAQFGSMT